MDYWYNEEHGITFYEYEDSDNPINVNKMIGHSWENFSLIPTSRPFVAPPTQKTQTVDIPGGNGIIDFTNSLHKWPVYNNRTGSWTFYAVDYSEYDMLQDNNSNYILDSNNEPIIGFVPSEDWSEYYTRILNALNGKKVAIVFDDDPDYFYYGRVSVSEWVSSNNGTYSGITISYDLFPYKLSKNYTYVNIYPDHNTMEKINIIGGSMPVVLDIYTEAGEPGGDTYSTVDLDFYNPELGINYTEVSFYPNLRYYQKAENISHNSKLASFIVTNLSGKNVCSVNWNTIESGTNYIYARYRIGEL